MTIQKIVPKSEKSLKPSMLVTDFKNIYVLQAIQDLLDTLKEKQRIFDIDFPGTGSGVGLASNQIEYPYEPVSDNDDTPKQGFYPANFVPPNIYVVSIRKERADYENCDPVEPSVYINAKLQPISNSNNEYNLSLYQEGCLSLTGFVGFSIPRYEDITIEAYDAKGEKIFLSANGFIARVHQHEIDHGFGKEYLNQLGFTHSELKNISNWINIHENTLTDESEWIIKNKLKCTTKNPDFLALRTWVNHELSKTKESTHFFTRNKLILGAAFTAIGLFAIHKFCKTDANIASDIENKMKI